MRLVGAGVVVGLARRRRTRVVQSLLFNIPPLDPDGLVPRQPHPGPCRRSPPGAGATGGAPRSDRAVEERIGGRPGADRIIAPQGASDRRPRFTPRSRPWTIRHISVYNPAVRRKPGALVPLELAICAAASDLRESGVDQFHGYAIAKSLAAGADQRLLTAYGTFTAR